MKIQLAVALMCIVPLDFWSARSETVPLPLADSASAKKLQARVDSILRSHGPGHYLTREAWLELANHYADNKSYKESAELWGLIARSREESLGVKSGKTADAYYQYGLLLERSGQLDAAEAALEHCVSLCPIKPGDGGLWLDYYGLLSYVQCRLGHWIKVRQTCRLWLALEHTHVDTEAWAHRRLACALAGMQAFDEARLEMELAINRNPSWGSANSIDGIGAHLDYARILRKGGRLLEAEKVLNALLQSREKDSSTDIPITLQICHELATCLQQAGRGKEAVVYSERACAGLKQWEDMEPWKLGFEELRAQLREAEQTTNQSHPEPKAR